MSFPADIWGRQPVLNEAGLAAMRYIRNIPTIVACGGKNGRQHAFVVRANINIAWVPEADTACCLAVKGGCCGQKKPGVIVYANESDVRRWMNGGGR